MKKYNYIYKITNLINGKIYIGKHSTNKLNDGYMGSGKIILSAIKKEGKDNFSKEYLAFTDNELRLNRLEIYYIRKYKSTSKENGYNITKGGEGTLGFSHPLSEDAKHKISEHLKGKQIWWKGRKHSDETKIKISKSGKGRKHSDETRLKISIAHKGVPRKQCNWKTPTGEIRQMDLANACKYHPDWILID